MYPAPLDGTLMMLVVGAHVLGHELAVQLAQRLEVRRPFLLVARDDHLLERLLGRRPAAPDRGLHLVQNGAVVAVEDVDRSFV